MDGVSTSTRALPVILALLVLLAYGPAWGYGWVYDDQWWMPYTWNGSPAMLPWALASWLGGGLPWAFHGLVLGLHLLNGVLFFHLVQRWLSRTAAWLVLTLFWLHPIASQAVAYVSGGMEVLLTTYVLLSAHGLLSGSRLGIVAGLASLGLAVSLKWSALPLLAVVPWALWVYRPSWRRAIVPAAIVAVYELILPAKSALAVGQTWNAEPLFSAWRGLGHVAWPSGLSIEHDVPSVLAGQMALAGTVVAGALAWFARWPVPWYAWLWVVALILPRCLTSGAPLTEHHLMTPFLAVWLLIGATADRWFLTERIARG